MGENLDRVLKNKGQGNLVLIPGTTNSHGPQQISCGNSHARILSREKKKTSTNN